MNNKEGGRWGKYLYRPYRVIYREKIDITGEKRRKKGKEKRKSFLIGVPHRERNLRGHEIVRYEEVVREVMVDDGTGNGASHILLAHHSRYRM